MEERIARTVDASFAAFACQAEAETAAAVDGAHVVLVNFAPVTRTVLSRMAPGATVIRYGIGVDNVDLAAAQDLGIRVANVPDYGLETVADHASAAILSLCRRLVEYDRAVRDRSWVKAAELGPIRSLRSTVVGFAGFGRIAQAVHDRMRPFGVGAVAADPFVADETLAERGVARVPMDELPAASDVVTLHLPLTRETNRFVDATFLSRMRPGGYLVNTSRGGLIDDAALVDALRDGRVGGAALDVFHEEPLPADSRLRDAPGVLLTPHAAFYDDGSMNNLQRLASEEAARAVHGEPLRCQVV